MSLSAADLEPRPNSRHLHRHVVKIEACKTDMLRAAQQCEQRHYRIPNPMHSYSHQREVPLATSTAPHRHEPSSSPPSIDDVYGSSPWHFLPPHAESLSRALQPEQSETWFFVWFHLRPPCRINSPPSEWSASSRWDLLPPDAISESLRRQLGAPATPLRPPFSSPVAPEAEAASGSSGDTPFVSSAVLQCKRTGPSSGGSPTPPVLRIKRPNIQSTVEDGSIDPLAEGSVPVASDSLDWDVAMED